MWYLGVLRLKIILCEFKKEKIVIAHRINESHTIKTIKKNINEYFFAIIIDIINFE